MVAKQVQLRRDTLTNLNAVIPADGEPAYNLTDDRLHMGDGSTYGGIPHVNFRDIQNSKFDYAADSGSANAVVVTLPYAPGSYGVLRVKFKATATNTGATTINVNGLGTKNIQKFTAGSLGALAAGDIVAGGIYEIFYDGTQFQLLTIQKSGLITVKQGDLSTSTGTFSTSSFTSLTPSNPPTTPAQITWGSSHVTAPGGEYGFCPGGYQSTFGGMSGWIPGSVGSSLVYGLIAFLGGSSVQPVNGSQRYITSSPPFDLMGQGEAAGFIFGLLDSAGGLVSHYAADVPPWAYNGPTDLRAMRTCPNTGKKFNTVMKKRSLDEIMGGAEISYVEREITQAVKNADMDLIPHPFGFVPDGHTVVLLNPYDDRVRDLIEYQNVGGGEDVCNALTGGKIYFDNTAMNLRGPCGVGIHEMRYKYSGR